MEVSEYNEKFLENIMEYFPKIDKVLDMIIKKHTEIIDIQPYHQSKERDVILRKQQDIVAKYKELQSQGESIKFDMLARGSILTSIGFVSISMQQKAAKLIKHELPLQVRKELNSVLRTINNLATFWAKGTEIKALTDDEIEGFEKLEYKRLKEKYEKQETK